MTKSVDIDLSQVARELGLNPASVQHTVELLDDGNTVPFITRYRKELTGALDEEQIRRIRENVVKMRALAERKATVLKSIQSQDKLTPSLSEQILAADSAKRLEDLYLPFKPKKQTLATVARQRGLEPLAREVVDADPAATELTQRAAAFISVENGLGSEEDVLSGVGHIIAESFSERANVRGRLRKILHRTGKLVCHRLEPTRREAPAAAQSPAAAAETHDASQTSAPAPAGATVAADHVVTPEPLEVSPAAAKTEQPASPEVNAAPDAADVPEQAPAADQVPAADQAAAGGKEDAPEGQTAAEPTGVAEPAVLADQTLESTQDVASQAAAEPHGTDELPPRDEPASVVADTDTLPAEEGTAIQDAGVSCDQPAPTDGAAAAGPPPPSAPQLSTASSQDAAPSNQTAPPADDQQSAATTTARRPAIVVPAVKSSRSAAGAKAAARSTKKQKKRQKLEAAFKDYFEFQEPISKIPPHRILAINRGERAKILRVKLEADVEAVFVEAEKMLVPPDHPHADFLRTCVRDALARLLIPSLEREVRREMTERAEEHAVEVFVQNLRKLLLQPPVHGHRVLAVDPGYRSGCKLMALDEFGRVLGHEVVHVIGKDTRIQEGRQKLARAGSHPPVVRCRHWQWHRLPRDGAVRRQRHGKRVEGCRSLVCDRQRGRCQRLFDQPLGPRGVARIRRRVAQRDFDRAPTAGSAV